ncbi:hypothetical protein B0H13DRAFT_2341124 [Mycena leptocephala]|nr:hypothetical protein B0H13DRAFT_2341124 [Mycena leptocephala]
MPWSLDSLVSIHPRCSDVLRMDDGPIAYVQGITTRNYCTFFGMVMFFTIRYGVPISNIPIAVFSFVTLSPTGSLKFISTCYRYNLAHGILVIVTQNIVSIIMIQRMYALYNRDKRILWGLSVAATCMTGLVVWLLQNQDSLVTSGPPGCHPHFSRKAAYHTAEAWGVLFVFDTIIFALTVCNAYSTRRRVGAQTQTDMPIYTLIIRDGAMYFAALALTNLVNIATFIIDGPLTPGSLTSFTTCISVTIVCRLVMNVYEKADVDAQEFNLSILQDCASTQAQVADASETLGVPILG